MDEIKLNKHKPLSKTQTEFWNPPKDENAHDPRGCSSYVKKYIDAQMRPSDTSFLHKPHPNITDSLRGEVKTVSVSSEENKERECLLADQSTMVSSVSGEIQEESGSVSDEEAISELEISPEFQIPQKCQISQSATNVS